MPGKDKTSRQREARGSHGNTRESFNVAVIGLSGVGKSTLIQDLVEKYKADTCTCADGKENRELKITVHGLELKFCESACKTDLGFPSTDIADIISADIFILVFAVDRLSSFEYVEHVKDAVCYMKGSDVAMIVVGNKHDATRRQLEFAYTDCIVSMDWELPYMEVSMKTGYNATLVLPYLFRHKSLKQYRHLILDETRPSQASRRKSTGSSYSPSLGNMRPRAFSVFGGSFYKRRGGQPKKEITPSEQPQRKKPSGTTRRVSFVNIFMCNDKDSEATVENNGPTIVVSDTFMRKRSRSLSTVPEDSFEMEPTPPTGRGQRRMSGVVSGGELLKKQMGIDFVETGKHESWLAAIRRHFKK